jgi:hypothetical protein
MLENPEILPQIVHAAGAKSTEYTSPEDVDHLCGRTKAYADSWKDEADRIWNEEHPGGVKVYEDDVSMMPVDKKAKMLEERDKKQEVLVESA